MRNFLRCVGYVIKGIGIVILIVAAISTLVFAMVLAGFYSAVALGLGNNAAGAFIVGYFIIGFGIYVGVDLCRDAR